MNDHSSSPCPWQIDQLRSNIVGIDTEVPILDGSRVPYVFLDNGASTPTFRHVLNVMSDFMQFYSGVHRGTGFKSILSTRAFDEAHDLAGEFVGADLAKNTVVFGKNTTELVNKMANRCDWREGDVVLTTLMEHHSNDLPWRKYATLVHIGVDDTGYCNLEELHRAFEVYKGRVRFLAVTGASNISGIVNPIHDMAALAHREGALLFVDAAQLAPHRRIEMLPDDDPRHLDFVVYSAHKMYSPYGIGVLVGSRDWFMKGDPDMVGGGVVEIVEKDFVAFSPPPAKEEAGSPNVPGAIALAASIHMLQSVGMDVIAEHEHELISYALEKMRSVPGIVIYGPTDPSALRDKVGVLAFDIENIPHAKVAAILSAEGGIGVRNGCFCAHPYVKRLLKFDETEAKTITDEILGGDRTNLPGMVRASFGCYNTTEDVDRLVAMLHRISSGDYQGTYVIDKASGTYWLANFDYPLEEYFPHFSLRKESSITVCGEAG